MRFCARRGVPLRAHGRRAAKAEKNRLSAEIGKASRQGGRGARAATADSTRSHRRIERTKSARERSPGTRGRRCARCSKLAESARRFGSRRKRRRARTSLRARVGRTPRAFDSRPSRIGRSAKRSAFSISSAPPNSRAAAFTVLRGKGARLSRALVRFSSIAPPPRDTSKSRRRYWSRGRRCGRPAS